MRIYVAQANFTIGDLKGNSAKIIAAIDEAKKARCHLSLFSEMALTGYPPDDFLLLPEFVEQTAHYLEKIAKATTDITAIVGTIRKNPYPGKPLFNSAAIIVNGQITAYQDKALLPTYDVFDEQRYFEPAKDWSLLDASGSKFAITICEDIWQHSALLKNAFYLRDPVSELKGQPIGAVLNLSASPFHVDKFNTRLGVVSKVAKTLRCPVIFCNQVGGNDSLIFDGYSMCLGSKGELLKVAKGFTEDSFIVDFSEEQTPIKFEPSSIEDLYRALVLGVKDYFHKSSFQKACLGVSGGIDSALVACIAKDALGAENVLAVGMPSRFSSEGSIQDASKLVHNLGINYRHIPIEEPFTSYLTILKPHFEGKAPDTTEENLQARIRGMLLMALSNKWGYIVLSTGNKSELAMGYSTLYGDMCGGLGVLSDVTKGQVYALANFVNRASEIIPRSTIDKPPSAELREDQKDSDSLPDYEIVDRVLVEYLENHLSPEKISKKTEIPLEIVKDLVRRIHLNEYKRRQSPPGLRVSEKAFTAGRKFPIVQRWI